MSSSFPNTNAMLSSAARQKKHSVYQLRQHLATIPDGEPRDIVTWVSTYT